MDINIPCTRSTRATSQGYGPKTDIFRPKFIEKGRTTPSPFNYKIKREFDIIDPKEITVIMYKDNQTKLDKTGTIFMSDGYTKGRSFENFKEKEKE